jgi:DNA-directed RNA polymerase II subunit RPB11
VDYARLAVLKHIIIELMTEDFRDKFKHAYALKDSDSYKPVEIIPVPKMQNGMTYVLHLEDHTLGDLIRIFLLKKKEVKFAGYKMPHPLFDKVEIKVQTTTEKTNEVVRETLNELQRTLLDLEIEFDKKCLEKTPVVPP